MLYSNGLVENYIIQICSYSNDTIVGEGELASCPRDARGEENSEGRPEADYSMKSKIGILFCLDGPENTLLCSVGLNS